MAVVATAVADEAATKSFGIEGIASWCPRLLLWHGPDLINVFNGGEMTVYGLYVRNGNHAGFWVQHRTWKGICAYVQLINGRASGRLPGRAPLYSGVAVKASAFDVRSGRRLSRGACCFDPTEHGFVVIAEPPWSHPALGSWQPDDSEMLMPVRQ